MKIIIAGGRDFYNSNYFNESLSKVLSQISDSEHVEIISGHANGADSLGEKFAKEHGLDLKIFPADWKSYGRAAGPIRNREMLEYAVGDEAMLVAFWDGSSKGTKNMIEQAKKKNIESKVFLYEKEKI